MSALPPAGPARRLSRVTLIRVALVGLFWVAMTGWLIRFEACPERFTGRFEGYRDLFKSGVLVRSSWMKIVANGTPVGYSHTEIDVDEKSTAEHYKIDSEMELELNILSMPQRLYTRLLVKLDILSRLQTFSFTLHSQAYETEITGMRVRNDQFLVTILAGGTKNRQFIRIPDDVILYSPMLEQALGAMEPGQTRIFKTLDPASLAVTDIRIRADRRETITIRGKPENATVLSSDYQGMTLWTWINKEGEVLKEETPLGWSMEAIDPATAMDYKNRKADPDKADMLAAAAVPSDRPIEDPRHIRRLDILLKGVDGMEADVTSPRQTVLGSETNGIRLRINARDWPATAAAGARPATALTNELAATPFIQADDPALVKQARAITETLREPADAARAINDWVFTHVRKNPAVSLPSAIAVLKQLEGDCNEHTYLAVGLCRAAGIPAKVKAGVVYLNEKFYYHAWVAAYVNGDWIEMDPTFGQPVADATHLALAEGEMAGQAHLLRYVGRLTIGILAAEKEPAP